MIELARLLVAKTNVRASSRLLVALIQHEAAVQMQSILTMSLADSGLLRRIVTALSDGGVVLMHELLTMDESDLRDISGIGTFMGLR